MLELSEPLPSDFEEYSVFPARDLLNLHPADHYETKNGVIPGYFIRGYYFGRKGTLIPGDLIISKRDLPNRSDSFPKLFFISDVDKNGYLITSLMKKEDGAPVFENIGFEGHRGSRNLDRFRGVMAVYFNFLGRRDNSKVVDKTYEDAFV